VALCWEADRAALNGLLIGDIQNLRRMAVRSFGSRFTILSVFMWVLLLNRLPSTPDRPLVICTEMGTQAPYIENAKSHSSFVAARSGGFSVAAAAAPARLPLP
jgi:hypothetical protein